MPPLIDFIAATHVELSFVGNAQRPLVAAWTTLA